MKANGRCFFVLKRTGCISKVPPYLVFVEWGVFFVLCLENCRTRTTDNEAGI